MSAPSGADIAVIGSGIVGLSCAWHLSRRGAQVVLLDPLGAGAAASFGNAGSISVGNVMPQATPGIAWKGLRMLADRDAPLKLDWLRLPHYARWLLQFVAAGRPARMQATMDALHAINHASRASWLELAEGIDARALVHERGYLHVYGTGSGFAAAATERAAMRARKVRFEVLDRQQLLQLEPGLGERFRNGVFHPDALALSDPGALCARLHAALRAHGVRSIAARVHAIVPLAGGCRLDTDQGAVHAGQVVVAAGAWSAALLRPLGVRLPLVPARGYHLMYAAQPALLQRPVLWAERYMVVSPMDKGVRMTSIKELTAPDSIPRFAAIRRRDRDARVLFPRLHGPPSSEWSGLRPCTPDSLPVIDRVAQRVFVACGHGHLGMTQGPVSGRLLDQLLAGEPPLIALQPYSAMRFRT